ncbi:MAG TPA: DUF2062 domain-containing protein [Hyphomicrobiaceae bacterium]|nr:DUF2062 domain-containing protein [Hyphomicrobiaceae bacterium]
MLCWPRRSWSRSLRYFGLRLLRQSAAPDVLARGVAVGLFAATLPIFGLQMLSAVVFAVVVRGHVPAALLATFWANPVTIPLMAGISYWTGAVMLGLDPQQIASDLDAILTLPFGDAVTLRDGFSAFYGRIAPIYKPLIVGAVPLAIAVGTAGYVAVYAAAMHFNRDGADGRRQRWQFGEGKGRIAHQSGD